MLWKSLEVTSWSQAGSKIANVSWRLALLSVPRICSNSYAETLLKNQTSKMLKFRCFFLSSNGSCVQFGVLLIFFSAKLFKVASFCSLQHGSLFERCRPLQPDCRDVRRRHAALRWRHRLVQRERARLSREGPAKRRSCRRQSRRRRQRRHRFRQNQRSRCRRKGSFELIFWKFYRFGWHSSFFGQACFMIALLVCSFAFDVKKHSRASTLLINSSRT